MKNKNLIVLSLLATMLISGVFISAVAAQEDKVDPSEPLGIPDAGLIAPAPDDNSTTTDDEPLYHITDDNQTLPRDAPEIGTEDANLIATNTLAGSDNTLAIAAIGVLSCVILVGTFGVVYYRRSAAKQQI
ncbi:MAG TPA: hypothetical protein VLL96_01200 [Candidatus Deferrimicrobiaceae bacterium]|nr:hypothetical protein [Candidatus Deferrimicrobiaceae bacterium]